LEHNDPLRHNLGDTKSKFVSLTTDLATAKRFAKDGVVLKTQIPKSRLTPSPDIFSESEVLFRGKITHAEVLRP
jgi:hypothetical protein